MKRRARFAVAAAAAFGAGSMPYLAQDPWLVVLSVFGYDSTSRHWGISRLLNIYVLSSGNLRWLLAGYLKIGKALMLAILVGAAIWMNWRAKKPELFLQCGLLAFLLVFWTPGFGLQYLAWLVPWVVAVNGWPALFWYTASGLFLCEAYTYWSRGLPWYFADMTYTRNLPGAVLYFSLELLAWIAVGCVAYAFWRRLAALGGSPAEELPSEQAKAAGFTSRS
jgi:hypothetical protein